MKKILVLASKAEDYIYKNSAKTPLKKEGGPAFFIKKTFDALDVEYKLAKSTSAKVEIKIINKEEMGRIAKEDKIKIPKKIKESSILISTIGPNSFNLNFLNNYKGNVFLDIQGFVRQKKSNKFGAKRFCDEITGIIDKIDILKCNSKEFKFLPEKVIEKAKEKILIETKGAKGVRLWKEGSRLDFKPKKIIKTENAIGAGDTFMAAFVYKLINTKDIEKSILFALDYASSYLAEINRT